LLRSKWAAGQAVRAGRADRGSTSSHPSDLCLALRLIWPFPTGFFDLLYLWPVYTNLPKRIHRGAEGETATTLKRRCMKRIPTKLQPWFEARRRFKLSHAHTQMARELGMNPRKLGSLANESQEPWKLPLPEFIAECYRKSFGRSQPQHVRSLEEVVQAEETRREEKKARKAEKI
jgi:hypothetical protein